MNSGIYEIYNRLNHRVYIGRSVNIQNRILQHLWSLRNGDHHNSALQYDWDRFGEANFSWLVLQRVPPHRGWLETLHIVEKYWINQFILFYRPGVYNQSN